MNGLQQQDGRIVFAWSRRRCPSKIAVLSSWFPLPTHPNAPLAYYEATVAGPHFVPGTSLCFTTLRAFLRSFRPRGIK
jgi:hypothetical protein